ncbi:unnamed protein product [Linum trigynum]|uniref:Uncharacterized protein n=1 Tax=Linum trigynum TaxID=586398 RepID=A0AAV2FM16_9ROSI
MVDKCLHYRSKGLSCHYMGSSIIPKESKIKRSTNERSSQCLNLLQESSTHRELRVPCIDHPNNHLSIHAKQNISERVSQSCEEPEALREKGHRH